MSKILIVSQHYFPENFRITDIAETLVKFGHEVTVLCGYPNYPEGYIYPYYRGKNKKKHCDEVINGVRIIRCHEHPRKHNFFDLFLNYYSISLSLKRKAKKLKEEFDVVLINSLSPVMTAWAGLAYGKKHKVKTILYCYDLWPDSLLAGGIKKNSLVYKYYERISSKIYREANKVLVTSKNFVRFLRDRYNVTSEYLPQYCEDLFGKITTKLDDNIFNYVFAGNIGKLQSVETLIKAASLIEDESIKIHIVGGGSDLKNCQKLAQDLNIKNVAFYGKMSLEQMPSFYSFANAMIVTLAKNEVISNTLPGKIQSYLKAGKPIIGAIDGETKTIIAEAKCGMCCDAEDYKSLARLLVEFKKCNQEELSRNAVNYYENNFRKDLFFDKLLKDIKEMAR